MRPIRVLIVEDEPKWAERFYLACRERKFEDENIVNVDDKVSALAQLDGWEPDMVLLDLSIPTTKTSGDANKRNGRDVLNRIRDINRSSLSRMAVLIISGQVSDDYEMGQYRTEPFVVDVYNKDSVTEVLPKLIRRAEKYAMPVYRDLKNHASELLPLFQTVMQEQSSAEQVLEAAHDLANRMLRTVGEAILGPNYPIPAGSDELFHRIEILRGAQSKLDSRSQYYGRQSAEIWVDGLPLQHLHTIRNYWNTYKHYRRMLYSTDHRCLLDINNAEEQHIFDALEQMGRAAEMIRPAVVDLLEWYLPWYKRQKVARA